MTLGGPLFAGAVALALTTVPARASAEPGAADTAAPEQKNAATPAAAPGSKGTSSASQISAAPAPPPNAQQSNAAFAGTLGGVYVPVSPGPIAAGFLRLERVMNASERVDLRVGVMGAYETTYYQSSFSFYATARTNYYPGAGLWGLGVGLGLGYGSFSPKDGYNADNGGSGILLVYATPALLRLGPKRRFELGVDAGLTKLFGFNGETDPFGALTVGYVSW